MVVNTKAMWMKVRKYPAITVGAVMMMLVFVAAIMAPWAYEGGPLMVDAVNRLQGASMAHWFGTDEFGRDILSRTYYGIRVSLQIGLSVVVISTVIGVIIGVLCGYYSKLDGIISRILDGLMAFPEIILAITLAAIWGAGIGNIIFALSFAYFPKMARIVRSSVLTAKAMECMQSGKAVGANNKRLLIKYVLPNCMSPIIVQATFCFASAILAEAALSFLGVGIAEPAASLGSMVSSGRNFMTIAPWIILVPGSAIMLMVLGLNILGDGLRDLLDPKL